MAGRKAHRQSRSRSGTAARSSAGAAAAPNHDTPFETLARYDALQARCRRLERKARHEPTAWSRWSAETERRDALVAQVARMPVTSLHEALIQTVIIATGLLDNDALNDLVGRRRLQRLVRELRSLLAI